MFYYPVREFDYVHGTPEGSLKDPADKVKISEFLSFYSVERETSNPRRKFWKISRYARCPRISFWISLSI